MAEQSAFKSGVGCATYRNTGSFGSPTFTVQSLIQSVQTNAPWDWHVSESRESAAKLYGKALMDLGFTVVMRADDADAGWEAWMAAALSRTTVLDLLILNGLISVEGVRGYRAEFLVSADAEPQEINNSIYTTFTLKPTFSANGYPRSVIMGAASTPSYSALAV